MLTFSSDPDVAEQQMNAIIFYLTAFGYIDGEFDFTEKTFVRIYIRQLVGARAKSAMPDADPRTRDEVVGKFVTHFLEVFEQIDRSVKDLFDEAVVCGRRRANGEDRREERPDHPDTHGVILHAHRPPWQAGRRCSPSARIPTWPSSR